MPANSPAKATADSSWLRHFWTALAALFLLAGGLIYHYLQRTDNQQKSEAITYLALPIKTIVGNNQYVSGQLSLQITPKQEQLLEERKVMLQTVINATLVEAYGTAERPSLRQRSPGPERSHQHPPAAQVAHTRRADRKSGRRLILSPFRQSSPAGRQDGGTGGISGVGIDFAAQRPGLGTV